ncbi:MAG TPA: DUF6529 family protein [Methylomirabilota bacterium]|nr:DUF6529 family protein [Methylomirabilota bacterium]
MTAATQEPPGASRLKFLLPLLVGAAVALTIGVFGNVYDPTGKTLINQIFTRTIVFKSWFATAAVTLALFQLASALRMYGRISVPREMPSWLPLVHRMTGTLALLFAIPVAYHCLWAIGFQDTELRTLIHSLAGCFFFGAFAAKVVVVHSRALPGWWLPVAGGSLFTGLTVLWLTSAFWFFTTYGLQFQF